MSDNQRDHIILPTWNEIRALRLQRGYLVDKLLPEGEVTHIFAGAGLGKSTIELQVCQAVGSGRLLWGRRTKQAHCVVIDGENSALTLQERTKALGPAENVEIWPSSHDPRPPRLDSSGWERYLNLSTGSWLWFDTIRRFWIGDDLDTAKTAMVMERLRTLCNAGYTVTFLNHSPKGNSATYKGPTTFLDQADYCMSLSRVRAVKKKDGKGKVDFIEIEDNGAKPTDTYRLGMFQKTRIPELFNADIRLRFNPAILGFETLDSDTDKKLDGMYQLLTALGQPTEGKFTDEARRELQISRRESPKLLQAGIERGLWEMTKGSQNRKIYTVTRDDSVYTFTHPLKGGVCANVDGKTDRFHVYNDKNEGGDEQTVAVQEFARNSGGSVQTCKQGDDDTDYMDFEAWRAAYEVRRGVQTEKHAVGGSDDESPKSEQSVATQEFAQSENAGRTENTVDADTYADLVDAHPEWFPGMTFAEWEMIHVRGRGDFFPETWIDDTPEASPEDVTGGGE